MGRLWLAIITSEYHCKDSKNCFSWQASSTVCRVRALEQVK